MPQTPKASDCVARRVRVTGRVTGVGFRWACAAEAARLPSITGYVRNSDDDRDVEAFIQGRPDEVEALLSWMRRGPPMAAVKAVHAEPAEPAPGLASFDIRR